MNNLDEQLKDILSGLVAISLLPDHRESGIEVAVKHIKSLFGVEGLKSLEERKQEFIESIRKYVNSGELDKEIANDFALYWLEKSDKGRKFRFEKEKSWDLDRRLSTWMRNKKKFSMVSMLRK